MIQSFINHPFLGKRYWNLPTQTKEAVENFEPGAINQPLGRVFSPTDLEIFQTIFWPISKVYGYTDVSYDNFLTSLDTLRPKLTQPLDFEQRLYGRLNNNFLPIQELAPYKFLHQLLETCWKRLDNNPNSFEAITPLLQADG